MGEEIGIGKKPSSVLSSMDMVAEGVPTAKSAHALSLKYNVDMPITKEIYLVLYKNKSPQAAVTDLMTRQKKAE